MLTDPIGMILFTLVYTGHLDNLGGKGHAANVAMKLKEGKLNVGHSLYIYNFYRSYNLVLLLLHATPTAVEHHMLIIKVTPCKCLNQNSQRVNVSLCHFANGVAVTEWKDKGAFSSSQWNVNMLWLTQVTRELKQ
jgi:hypothetical protein